MSENKKQFPVFGIALLLIGFGILFDKLELFEFTWKRTWPILLGVIGIWMTISAILYSQRGKIFSGSVLFLFGVMFFLKNYQYISLQYNILIPSILVIIGLSFFMLFVYEPKDWGLIFPSIAFLGGGLFITFTNLGYFFYNEIWDFLAIYWPVFLILVGVSMLFSRPGKSKTNN
jgi:hypothetical protein